jgi:hypothetical protein
MNDLDVYMTADDGRTYRCSRVSKSCVIAEQLAVSTPPPFITRQPCQIRSSDYPIFARPPQHVQSCYEELYAFEVFVHHIYAVDDQGAIWESEFVDSGLGLIIDAVRFPVVFGFLGLVVGGVLLLVGRRLHTG